jgi:hypothetical protein
VPNDGTATLSTLIPPRDGHPPIPIITDKNLNVLSFTEITPQNLVNDLEFRSLDVLGSISRSSTPARLQRRIRQQDHHPGPLFNHPARKQDIPPRRYESDTAARLHLFDT